MDDESIKHLIEVLGPNYKVDRRIYRIKIKPIVTMCGGNCKSLNGGNRNFTMIKNEMSSQEGGLTITFGNNSHHPPAGPPPGHGPKPHHGPHHRPHRQPSKAETIMVCVMLSLMFIVVIVSVIAGIVQGKKSPAAPASSAPGTGTPTGTNGTAAPPAK